MGTKITKIGTTDDKISSRGGIALFLKYISGVGLYSLVSHTVLSAVTFGNKGLQLGQFLKQMFAFMIDGTNTGISHFDSLKKDSGYAALLENTGETMASSHQIKRFVSKLSVINSELFSRVLHELFIWRLKMEKPEIIILGIDTMVMDNDSAEKREGCEPTYKKKKGFQPLHICWGPFLIDVLFRKGSAHSNHGTDYTDRIRAVVGLIRRRYSEHVPVILCADSGFADQKAYEVFEEELGIHYITTSRIYADVKEYIGGLAPDMLGVYSKGKSRWGFAEFGNMLKSWKKAAKIFVKKEIQKK